MDAEGAALANNPVEKEGCGLGDAIIFDEELLKLIDDQQRSRNRFASSCLFVSWQILHAEFPKQVAATLQLLVNALEDAQGKFTIAFDGDNSCMRQTLRRVTFE